MDNLLAIRLRAVNFDLKINRAYRIHLGKDLSNHWYVTVNFGRYNTKGTSKTQYFDTRQEAYNFIDAKLKRRLSSPKRIGCPYQMVAVEGDNNTLSTIDKKVIERFSWFGRNINKVKRRMP